MTTRNVPTVSEVHVNQSVKRAGFLDRLSVPQKLLLLSLALGTPMLFAVGNQTWSAYKNYTQAQHAAQVTDNYRYVVQLQQTLRVLDGLDAADISQNYKTYVSQLDQATSSLNTQLEALNIPVISQLSASLRAKATDYLAKVAAGKASAAELSKINQDMQRNEVTQLFVTLNQNAGISGANTQEVLDLLYFATHNLPFSLPEFGRVYNSPSFIAYDAATKQNGVITETQRALFVPQMADARLAWQRVVSDYNALAKQYPELAEHLNASMSAANQDTTKALDLTDGTLNGNRLNPNTDALLKAIDAYLKTQYVFFGDAVKHLQEELTGQANAARTAFLTLLLATLLLLGLVAFLLTRISRAISNPLRRLTNATQQLSQGNFDVQVPVTTADEIGVLTRSFNAAATQLKQSAEQEAIERAEAQRLQQNVGEFLDVTMDIAEGDLTKRGKVTEDVLGNVVDSINLMADELGTTLKQVQTASVSVANGSQQMRGATEQVEHGVRMTAVEAQQVAQRVEEITTAIREMAQRAQQSADTARQALQVSQEGGEAVQATLDGMQNIRREVQQVSQRIKSLGDRSLEIQEIVDTISQIARRTNLLALNASVEAAGAGEAGGRFSAVAEEIRELANTSAQATNRVANLIRNVQIEVQDVTLGTEESAREVEQGYRIAGTAGQRLREIGELAEQSAQLAEDVAASTQEQVSGVEQVSSNVQQIATIAQSSEDSVQQGRMVAEELEELARQLNATLARFRLPA